ncbi:hypothetical protein [Mycoplasma sp. 46852]|uniref:hypothetical protein n=1 Tax=Mycoplasma sp. 46852 TaxID=3401683 RepID=UPI003AB07588
MKFKKWFMFPLMGMSAVAPIATMSASATTENKNEKLVIVPETEVVVKEFKPLYIEQYLNILDFYIDSIKENIFQAYGVEKVEKDTYSGKTVVWYTDYNENIKNTIFAKSYENDYFNLKNELSDLIKTNINDELVQTVINPNKFIKYLKETKTSQTFNFDLKPKYNAWNKFDYAKYQYAKTINLLMLKEFNQPDKDAIIALWNLMDETVESLSNDNYLNVKKQKEDYKLKFKSNQIFEDMFYNKKSKINELQENEYIKDIDTENVFAYKKAPFHYKDTKQNKLEIEKQLNIYKKYLSYDEFKSLFFIFNGNPMQKKIQSFNSYEELVNYINNENYIRGFHITNEGTEIPSHMLDMKKYIKMQQTEYKLLKEYTNGNSEIGYILPFENINNQWLKWIISSKFNELYSEEIYTDDAFYKFVDAQLYFNWTDGRNINYDTFYNQLYNPENNDYLQAYKEIFHSPSLHWFPMKNILDYALGRMGIPLDFMINNLDNQVMLKDILNYFERVTQDGNANIYYNTFIDKMKAAKNAFHISEELANKQIEKLHNIESEILNDLKIDARSQGLNDETKNLIKSYLSSMVRNYELFLKKISKTDAESKLELKLEEIDTIKQSAFILKELANKVIDYMTATKQIDLSQQKEKLNNLNLETDNINDLVNNYHEALLLLSKLPFTEEDKDTVFSEKFDKNFNKIQNRPEMITLLNALPKNTKPQIIIKETETTPQEDNKGINPIFAGLISATVVCGIASLIGLGLLVKNKK